MKDTCLKCKKPVSSRQNRLNCNLCKKVLHLKYTELTKSQFQSYQKGKLLFNCVYCTNYSCLKCDKHIYDNVDSVCCDKCDKWIHKTCANISDKKYKDMQENKPGEEIWLCIGCLDFPFSNIDNKKLLLLHENENNLTANIDLTKFSISCSICLRKLGKPLKGIPCNRCKPLFTEDAVS